jgi:hypothetical protein
MPGCCCNTDVNRLMTSELAQDANTQTQPQVPQQQEMPLAVVHGQPVLQIPQDLYIPPDALEVILDAFEGPLTCCCT